MFFASREYEVNCGAAWTATSPTVDATNPIRNPDRAAMAKGWRTIRRIAPRNPHLTVPTRQRNVRLVLLLREWHDQASRAHRRRRAGHRRADQAHARTERTGRSGNRAQ